MAVNRFGHIDLRVKNAREALEFYAKLMPELGFTLTFHGGAWHVFAGGTHLPQAPYFAVTEDPEHVPNGNRIAFWAPSPQEVDRIAGVVAQAGGRRIEGPEKQPYSPTYYAVYFEDPSGNQFEVYYREN